MVARLFYGLLTILLLAIFLANSGCGVARANCHLGGQVCDSLLGKDAQEAFDRLDKMQESVEQIKKEITTLTTQVNYMISAIQADTVQLQTLQSVLSVLQSTVTANETTTLLVIENLNAQIAQTSARIDYNDTRIADMITDIVALEQQDSVTEYIYPCGDRVNAFDEVIVRTKSGKLLAYFESGGNRFLSLLTPGNYTTTDGGSCKFSVNSQNQIINGHR